MADRSLAGYSTIGTFTPTQLYAGEKQVVTTQGFAVAAGLVLGTLDDQGHTNKFPIVALVGGALVAYNAAGIDGSEVPYGVLPHAIDTSATGYNAATESPVIIEGVLNYDALDTAVAYATLKASFAGAPTGIVIQQLL